ncbi:Transmembrane protein 94 [Echinococcus granulosus]|nr:Transmembrane protein 94 [Echinococcus granulosus]
MPTHIPIIWNAFSVVLLVSASMCTIIASIKRLESHFAVTVTEVEKIVEDINYMRTHDLPRIYAPLYLPHSLSYNLQMTYRDGNLANVPVSLLVEGDIINLRPGQTIGCDCILVTEAPDEGSVRYSAGDIFLPHLAKDLTNRSPYPSMHLVDNSHLAVVTASPVIEQIKNILKQKAHNKKTQIQSTSSFVFLRGSVFCSLMMASVTFILGIIISSIRVFVHNRLMLISVGTMWAVTMSAFLLITAISLFAPLIWILTLGMSVAHLRKYARSCGLTNRKMNSSSTRGLSLLRNLVKTVLVQPDSRMEQLLLHLGRISRMCFVDKKGIISLPIPTPEKLFFFRERQNRHRKAMRTRSLGPNPIPPSNEFLAPPPPTSSSFGTSRSPIKARNIISCHAVESRFWRSRGPRSSLLNDPCVPEILNINSPPDYLYKPHFESPKWGRYLDCLKPIGLNLLLNNCQPLTREHYAAFADHLTRITAVSQQYFAKDGSQSKAEAVAVVNNRCLCGLAYHMGFRSSVLQHYSLAASLGIYKAIEKTDNCLIRPKSGAFNSGQKENLLYFRSQALRIQEAYASVPKDNSTEPIPVPYCFCTIYREAVSCGYHVMTQGSGDLVTALCTNFWNGRELLSLMDSERSKMLDFYNLNVSTSYCLAFAYMPLLQSTPLVQDNRPDGDRANRAPFPVLKLPVNFELRSRLTTRPSSTSTVRPTDVLFDSLESVQHYPKRRLTRNAFPPNPSIAGSSGEGPRKVSNIDKKQKLRTRLPRVAFSCGSLPRLACQTNSSTSTASEFPADSAALQDAFSKQIFLGMVSLQYQAMPGIVETIRKLNQACIRFVHFSQDNQLRSRVFAERLGLEADWNCHISLADPPPEVSRTTSQGTRTGHLTSVPSRTSSIGTGLLRRPNVSLGHGGVAVLKQPYSLSSPNVARVGVQIKKRSVVAEPVVAEAVSNSSMPLVGGEDGDMATSGLWIGFDMDTEVSDDRVQWSPPNASTKASNASLNIVPEEARKSFAFEDSVFLSSSSSSSSSDVKSVDADSQEGLKDHPQLEEDAYNYVFANKSRLPSGIRNIRSHLENVDNVPLKVSLFTDCTPSAVGEMIGIMQEYGETVCVVGSCLSMTNAELFCRGDTAIALFPLLPRVCGHEPIAPVVGAKELNTGDMTDCASLPLLNLAGRLVALGAALISRASLADFDILQLVSQAHASVNNIHLCITFAIASSFAAALFYLLSLAFLPAFPVQFGPMGSTQPPDTLVWLPPVLLGATGPMEAAGGAVVGHIAIGGQVLWLTVAVIPCLATSIFGRTVERNHPLQQPPVKRNEMFSRERILRLLWVTAARFLPSVVICWAVSLIQTFITCPTYIDHRLVCLPHSLLNPVYANVSLAKLPEYATVLLNVTISQEIPFFLLVTYLVLISFSYANSGQWIHHWRISTNLPWLILSVIILLAHTIYLAIILLCNDKVLTGEQHRYLLVTLACGLLWCPILLLVNEIINWKERAITNAEDRFAKLFFDTKLGMYSPV